MRIIAGAARGRQIAAPPGRDTRPTLARVKESLFGILQWEVPGARVLDLFAGSGNLGLEALSRGAEYAAFNDKDRACAALIRKNVESLGMEKHAKVYCMDYQTLLGQLRGQQFDLVFLDPPYASPLAQDAAETVVSLGLLAPKGKIVVEHEKENPPHDVPGRIRIVDTRRYGIVHLALLEEEP